MERVTVEATEKTEEDRSAGRGGVEEHRQREDVKKTKKEPGNEGERMERERGGVERAEKG